MARKINRARHRSIDNRNRYINIDGQTDRQSLHCELRIREHYGIRRYMNRSRKGRGGSDQEREKEGNRGGRRGGGGEGRGGGG